MSFMRVLAIGLAFIVASSVLSGSDVNGQRQSRSKKQRVSTDRQPSSRSSSRQRTTSRSPRSDGSRKLNPQSFMHAYYKVEALLEPEKAPLNFVTSDYQWDQPGGPGSSITLTYSYSNLLDGDIKGLTVQQLKAATEEAFAIWSSVAPFNFVEVEDVGPDPTAAESEYSASGAAQIRIGTHVMDGASGNELAHAYLPFSNTSGLAGDLHFDVDEDWGVSNGGFFLETMLHEVGHCLGLDHEDDVDAIMNSFIMNRFSGLGTGFLLDDDVDGIQSVYGAGAGDVSPQDEDPTDEDPTDEDPTDEDPTDEDPTDEDPQDEDPTDEDPTDEDPTDEDPTDEDPTDEDPTDEDPTDEDPTDEDPTDEDPTDEDPADEELVNNIVAELDTETGLLSLKGDSFDNSMIVLSSRWFTIVMGSDDTTINGERGYFWRHRGDKAMDIVTSAGNDSLFLFGVSADTATVDLGDGDDAMGVVFSRIETVEAEAGEGDDALLTFFNRIDSLIDSGFESVW